MLRLTDINKSFWIDRLEHKVLQNLSLTADCDKITVILGPSGCGKTTLLRLMCKLEQPDSGTIELPDGLHIGMMFQEARLMPWLTCAENIVFGQEGRVSKQECAALINTVGLTGFAKAYPIQLSGGMQQRVALARTLAQKSQLILMDEPFAALDYFTRANMQRELLKIKEAVRTGIIFVTHNIDEALQLADTIMIMRNGSISKTLVLPPNSKRDILSAEFIGYKREILAALQTDIKAAGVSQSS